MLLRSREKSCQRKVLQEKTHQAAIPLQKVSSTHRKDIHICPILPCCLRRLKCRFPVSGILERLIQDSGYRTQVIIELCELRAFLRQRSTEIEVPAYQNLMTVAPEAIQQVGLPAVQKLLQAVQGCHSALTSERINQLLALKTSQRYFQRTAAALQQQANQEGKFYRSALMCNLLIGAPWSPYLLLLIQRTLC